MEDLSVSSWGGGGCEEVGGEDGGTTEVACGEESGKGSGRGGLKGGGSEG